MTLACGCSRLGVKEIPTILEKAELFGATHAFHFVQLLLDRMRPRLKFLLAPLFLLDAFIIHSRGEIVGDALQKISTGEVHGYLASWPSRTTRLPQETRPDQSRRSLRMFVRCFGSDWASFPELQARYVISCWESLNHPAADNKGPKHVRAHFHLRRGR